MTNTTEITTTQKLNPDVARRRAAAYWYAVGRHDAGDGPDRSDEFAVFAVRQAVAYYYGEVWFLGSVSTQWAEFLSYTICDYDQEDDNGYWHCDEAAVSRTPCCKWAYCANHAWMAEEHETAGAPIIGCDGTKKSLTGVAGSGKVDS